MNPHKVTCTPLPLPILHLLKAILVYFPMSCECVSTKTLYALLISRKNCETLHYELKKQVNSMEVLYNECQPSAN